MGPINWSVHSTHTCPKKTPVSSTVCPFSGRWVLSSTVVFMLKVKEQCHYIFALYFVAQNILYGPLKNRLKQFRKSFDFRECICFQSSKFGCRRSQRLYGLLTVGNNNFSHFKIVAVGYVNTSKYFISLIVPLKQCCGSGMIYSGSGSSFEFSEFRIRAKVSDLCGSGSNLY